MYKVLSFLLVASLLQFHSSDGQQLANQEEISATEGEPFQACFTITGTPVGGNFVINVTGNITVFPNLDETLTFEAGTTDLIQCISDLIVPVDTIARADRVIDEPFLVTTTFQGSTSLQMPFGTIVLQDTTVLVIGFAQPSYTFNKGVNDNQICVPVDGTLVGSQQIFTADILYIAGTAPTIDDFVGLTTVTFDPNNATMQCLPLNINLFEGAEPLTVQLIPAQSPLSIDPNRNMTTVVILDLNAHCGPPPSGDETVTPVITHPPHRFTTSNVVTNPGDVATYYCTVSGVVLGNDQRTCTMVDNTTAEWRPVQTPTCAEARTIGIAQPSYTFIEGTDSNQVCITLDGTIQESVALRAVIAYTLGTAVADDYIEGPTTVIFDSNSTAMECVTLAINNDDNFEGAEMLTVRLTYVDSGLAIDFNRNMAAITILDLDANCGDPPMGDGLTVAPSNPPYGMYPSVGLVANPGAVATYTCTNQNFVLNGLPQLTCTAMDGTAAWSPADPPACVQAAVTDPPPTVGAAGAVSTYGSVTLTAALMSLVINNLLLFLHT